MEHLLGFPDRSPFISFFDFVGFWGGRSEKHYSRSALAHKVVIINEESAGTGATSSFCRKGTGDRKLKDCLCEECHDL